MSSIYPPESPVQFFFWSSTGGDADSKKKLFEVDEPVPVCVKRPAHLDDQVFVHSVL